MSIFYKVQKRINPHDLNQAPKYYLIEKSIGYIGREALIKDMCLNKSLTPQEASAALDYFFEAIPRFLKLGFTVGLQGLGHFYTSIKSIGSDTKEEATAHKKLVTKVHFIAGKKFRDDIDRTPIEKLPDTPDHYYVTKSHEYLKDSGKREKTIEMVRNCLKEGLETELIMRLTGLSKEEIEEVKVNI